MPIIVPDAAELILQTRLLKTALAVDAGWFLRLYRNDYTPVAATVLADFTEANFTGYAQQNLIRAGWNNPATINGAAVATYGQGPIIWTCGMVGNTIYGYYIVGTLSNQVEWCQRFTDPIVLTNGLQLGLTPTFSGRSEF